MKRATLVRRAAFGLIRGRVLGLVLGLGLALAAPSAAAGQTPGSDGHIGATAVLGGVGIPADGAGVGGGVSARLEALFGRLAVGPEVAIHGTGRPRSEFLPPCPPPGCEPIRARSRTVWHVGGVALLDLSAGGPLTPYVVGGLGLYSWRTSWDTYPTGSVEFLGYSAGAGARLGPGRWSAVLEGRRHDNLSRSGSSEELGFWTVQIGVRLTW